MVAKVIKVVDGKDIEYGTYDYNNKGDINYVNLLAESIKDVDCVETRLEFIYDPIEKQIRDWLDRQIDAVKDCQFSDDICSLLGVLGKEIQIHGLDKICEILRLPRFIIPTGEEKYPYEKYFVYNDFKFFELSKED